MSQAAMTAVLCSCLMLGACASPDSAAPRQPASYQQVAASRTGELATRTALDALGAPYRYGGRGPEAFDCSGLVYYAYRSAGIDLPRTSTAQFQAANPISLRQARAGDLVFFRYGDSISHVGIYLGEQRFVHAPSSGKSVSLASLDNPHYRDRFVGAGRIPDTR